MESPSGRETRLSEMVPFGNDEIDLRLRDRIPLADLSSRKEIRPSGMVSFGDDEPEQHLGTQVPRHTHSFNYESKVNHELTWYHVVFITITGVFGAGLYSESGEMLHVGGPGAVVIPYSIFGLLAWSIMQCIGEMVCRWPISNALVLYVQKFVDHELGTAVGVAYWFTYSTGFASLLAAAASEAQLWTCDRQAIGFGFLTAITMALICVNCLGVKLYGDIEVFLGIVKITLILVVISCMIAIAVGAGPALANNGQYWSNSTTFFAYDRDEVSQWFGGAFFIGLQIAAWSYVGVEIPAVTALETRITTTVASPRYGISSYGTLWWSMIRLPIFITVIYLVAGTMASLNVRSTDPRLPKQLSNAVLTDNSCTPGNSSSVFVISALDSHIQGLPTAFTVFLLVTAWSSASTALYVSSRALYGLCCDMEAYDRPKGPSFPTLWWWDFRKSLGETRLSHNNKKVPVAAILVSALAFVWVPFLRLAHNGSDNTVLTVLSSMGSVCCVIVWTCECIAFARFRIYLELHEDKIKENESLTSLLSTDREGGRSWQAWGQPRLAMVTIACCLVILTVADGSALWIGWRGLGSAIIFITAYITPLCFLLLWISLKTAKYGWNPFRKVDDRYAWWPDESLRNWNNGFKRVLEGLNQQRDRRLRSG